jgi:hypothetical protein
MNITKYFSALSIAFALIGGAVMMTPSSAHAGKFISFDALKKNTANTKGNNRPGKQANPHTRGCSDIARCHRG